MRIQLAVTTAAALFLAGCGGFNMPGKDTAPTTAELVTATATIVSVDKTERVVRLTDDETGQAFTVIANDGIRNLDQLEAGDVVVMEYYESTTLQMADAGDPGTEVTTVLSAEAVEGALPGGLEATTTSLVVEVVSYDADTGMASIRLPDGSMQRTVVKPEMRSFAAGLTRGDRVLVTMVEAVAVTIEEVQG